MKKRSVRILLLAVLTVFGTVLPVFPVSVGETRVEEACIVNAVEFDESTLGDFGVNAGSAFLMDADSGSVLYAKNADLQRGMASTTKIMTALVVLETLSPETVVEITPEMTGVEGSSLYLTAGEHLTVQELLYGLLLESGNDAAVALALSCDTELAGFVSRMNDKAKRMGLTHTQFANPHGLSAAGHYTTARELAYITAEALKNPAFAEIVSTAKKHIPYRDQKDARYLTNHNPLLCNYDGMIGVKTGWTTADGKCFVTAARRDGLTLIAVSLGDENISVTHRALLDRGFATFTALPLETDAEIVLPLVGGTEAFIRLEAEKGVVACVPKGEALTVRLETPPFVYAGTKKGSAVGRAVFYRKDTEVGSILLRTATDAPIKRISFWEKLFGQRETRDG